MIQIRYGTEVCAKRCNAKNAVVEATKAKFHYASWFEAGRRQASNQIAQWNLVADLLAGASSLLAS